MRHTCNTAEICLHTSSSQALGKIAALQGMTQTHAATTHPAHREETYNQPQHLWSNANPKTGEDIAKQKRMIEEEEKIYCAFKPP